ncbi:hypothetical protein Nepgr_025227 [Nepenthes gracilis]|uniref:Uncharacterized protein n=1 Tax=Nepenthes gracilis TaxID=150966 RepID=A0AAD3Y0S3_NEPGR|nr:hypothetical protein Nepgr_025227 [Nepenthes gracilis]
MIRPPSSSRDCRSSPNLFAVMTERRRNDANRRMISRVHDLTSDDDCSFMFLGVSSGLMVELGVVPTDQLGGEPRPCTSIAKLRKNIAESRKQFDAPRARLDIPPPIPANSLSPSSEGGGHSGLKKSKKHKKKRSPIPYI